MRLFALQELADAEFIPSQEAATPADNGADPVQPKDQQVNWL